ncbi:SHOCT domain-containing protein [Ancylobacter sp. Lp-2]|uniref:SHOCT domain-containing protein n=1 Tax=Ancylobacter sp. Lp-2 TaxID=2881339 RepID=UPI001E6045C6|nr:SHOCT domain-containing protein [Ancylobacter sp. Lp-2]MCB4771826.1 SHOCT domain-containing protein [Ancylobacter sp. Lp-2]
MTDATSTEQTLRRIAEANGVSTDAARTLLDAIRAGGGSMAQFSHPELGGMGQWSFGGMLMIGDMFNNGLKAKVDRLCHELADLAATLPPPVMGGGYRWWPDGLGNPSTAGAQNDMRYAFFPSDRRLVISQHGVVTVFDTGEHMISGVSQQQGGTYNLSFSSQFGQVDLGSLRRVPGTGEAPADPPAPAQPWVAEPALAPVIAPAPVFTAEPVFMPAPVLAPAPAPASAVELSPVPAPAPADVAVAPLQSAPSGGHDDIFDKLERLGELAKKGILTEAEFQAKKTELLARL